MSLPFRPSLSSAQLLRRSEALFAWSAREGGLASLTGQVPTFVRGTDRTQRDATGKLTTVCEGVPGIDAVLNSATGLYEPTLALEPTRANLCLQSENFGTTWADIGTPTRTAAALTCGDLVLDLLGDDAAGTLEGKSQTVNFTANAVKAISVFLAAGTSTSTVIRLRDTTAGADRLLATITWAAGVPTIASVSGGVAVGSPVLLGTVLGKAVYRFEFQAGTVTAANTNSLQVYPATSAALAVANTGTVYAGGFQAENAPMPSSYIKTTTATVTRNGEALSYPALWPIQDNETWYIRMVRPRWADMSGSLTNPQYILSRGATGPQLGTLFLAATRQAQAVVYDGTTSQASGVINIPSGTGGFIEVLAQFVNLKTTAQCRIGDATGYAADSAAVAALPSLTPTLVVGDAAQSAGNQLHGEPTDAVVVSGLQSLATMRGIAQR